MKNLLFLLLLICCCSQINAQQVPDYSQVKNGTKAQTIARANEAALQAATYLLSMPPDTTNEDIQNATQYLILWMTQTDEYTFEVDEAAISLYEGNTAMMPVLLASMVEYQMKNPANKDDRQKVTLNAAKRMIAYAHNPANNIIMPDGLKKAAEAEKKGELDKYLASLGKQ